MPALKVELSYKKMAQESELFELVGISDTQIANMPEILVRVPSSFGLKIWQIRHGQVAIGAFLGFGVG
jgi:hypothetical protein